MSLVYDSLAKWSMAQGSVSSYCPGETIEFICLMMIFRIAISVH